MFLRKQKEKNNTPDKQSRNFFKVDICDKVMNSSGKSPIQFVPILDKMLHPSCEQEINSQISMKGQYFPFKKYSEQLINNLMIVCRKSKQIPQNLGNLVYSFVKQLYSTLTNSLIKFSFFVKQTNLKQQLGKCISQFLSHCLQFYLYQQHTTNLNVNQTLKSIKQFSIPGISIQSFNNLQKYQQKFGLEDNISKQYQKNILRYQKENHNQTQNHKRAQTNFQQFIKNIEEIEQNKNNRHVRSKTGLQKQQLKKIAFRDKELQYKAKQSKMMFKIASYDFAKLINN